MFSRVAVLSALALSSVAVAHADTLTGAFAASGADTFATSAPFTITFTSGAVTGATATGGFAPYLTAGGEAISFFPATAGVVPFNPTGTPIVVPPTLFAPGQTGALLLAVTGTSSGQSENYSLYLQNYNAVEVSGIPGCQSAAGTTQPICLDVTGSGYFLGSGAVTYNSSPATFTFTSQQVSQQNAVTSFSASTNAIPSAVTPEPSSLVLLGTGLIGLAGAARRKFRA